jgi:hypothetical protein
MKLILTFELTAMKCALVVAISKAIVAIANHHRVWLWLSVMACNFHYQCMLKGVDKEDMTSDLVGQKNL